MEVRYQARFKEVAHVMTQDERFHAKIEIAQSWSVHIRSSVRFRVIEMAPTIVMLRCVFASRHSVFQVRGAKHVSNPE